MASSDEDEKSLLEKWCTAMSGAKYYTQSFKDEYCYYKREGEPVVHGLGSSDPD